MSVQDAEAPARQEREHAQRSAELANTYTARMAEATTLADLQRVAAELMPALKAHLVAQDLTVVRGVYAGRVARLRREPVRNGT